MKIYTADGKPVSGRGWPLPDADKAIAIAEKCKRDDPEWNYRAVVYKNQYYVEVLNKHNKHLGYL